MTFEDLKNLYLQKKQNLGLETYKYISEILAEAKEIHKRDWLENPTRSRDHEQSWRAFKGKNFEKLIQYILTDRCNSFGLKVVSGSKLEKTQKLSKELSQVKRNLLVDYGEFGSHLPDVDIIIYNPEGCKIISVISVKTTLRERIAQTGYWKYKLLEDQVTKHIKVYFVTLDEDGTLIIRSPAKKGRAIVETDLDGSYVLTKERIEQSDKVKLFEYFIDDLMVLMENAN